MASYLFFRFTIKILKWLITWFISQKIISLIWNVLPMLVHGLYAENHDCLKDLVAWMLSLKHFVFYDIDWHLGPPKSTMVLRNKSTVWWCFEACLLAFLKGFFLTQVLMH